MPCNDFTIFGNVVKNMLEFKFVTRFMGGASATIACIIARLVLKFFENVLELKFVTRSVGGASAIITCIIPLLILKFFVHSSCL